MNQKPNHTAPRDRHADKPLPLPHRDSPRYEEALLDAAVAETLPASDPISPAADPDVPTSKPNPDRGGKEAWKGWPKA